jgi:hypothetical protein
MRLSSVRNRVLKFRKQDLQHALQIEAPAGRQMIETRLHRSHDPRSGCGCKRTLRQAKPL